MTKIVHTDCVLKIREETSGSLMVIKKLMKSGNKDNLEYVLEAVQKSVDQVHEAYQHPDRDINTDSVTDLIPFVDPDAVNNAPMFQMKNGSLLRRKKAKDLQDYTTKSNWWGVTTIGILQIAHNKKRTLPYQRHKVSEHIIIKIY